MKTERMHYHFATIDSTNSFATKIAREGAAEGTIITADEQLSGKGRHGRRWESQTRENLLLSVILRPTRSMEEWGGLPLLAGVAVHDAIMEISGLESKLKWPNDVLISGRKVCGILIEAGQSAHGNWCVAGIGLNVNQETFPSGFTIAPTSLHIESRKSYNRAQVRDAVVRWLNHWYSLWTSTGTRPVVDAWKLRTDMFGKTVVMDVDPIPLHGVALDLTEEGYLILKLENGEVRHISSGDVFVLNT